MSAYNTLRILMYELQPWRLDDFRNFCSRCQRESNCLIKFLIPMLNEFLIAAKSFILEIKMNTWLYIILWTGIFSIMHRYEWGSLWVILSLFGAVFLNLGTRKEGESELSAYSVFNKGCQRLLGTMTVEQFEREILHKTDEIGREREKEREREREIKQENTVRKKGKKARRGYEEKLRRRERERIAGERERERCGDIEE
mmetsp:Transcript_39362/g.40099  ORF Transcript_39362/g.40099 Transcript_39362/m.40099 type:complete len:199 (+) Transcript_39362:143-739(+)